MKTLTELLAYSPTERDRNWENHFFSQLTNSSVELISEEPITGPDNWPYLLVKTPSDSKSLVEPESVQKILAWLADKGIGLVVNPEQEYPDYVFPYGMIWHFRENGLFFRDQSDIPTGSVVISAERGLTAGPPSESFLPGYVRKVLREFFRDQGFLAVKILVMGSESPQSEPQSQPRAKSNFYDLAFSLSSLGNPPESEYSDIAEAISWFLPPHYSILLTQEKDLPTFFDL
jgi:hypothetical protein